MITILQIILWIVAVASVGLLALTLWGLYLKHKGQTPFDAAGLDADGGKYATSHDGQKIEYFTYGSADPSAPVVVNMHGSGPEALSEKRFYAPICEALGVRGISISLPGHGYTHRCGYRWMNERTAGLYGCAQSVPKECRYPTQEHPTPAKRRAETPTKRWSFGPVSIPV